ncbi:hypothetical protein [Halobacillus seohaensis]|uniref:Uncharacterized protein n=1 Tax=Halobacillus seohaensis TaxID=447421 RepID=A0ABW2ESW2_9BACI
MKKDSIKELVTEETQRLFPKYKEAHPSFFYEIVKKVTDDFFDAYVSDTLGSEAHTRELIASELEVIKKALR